MEKTTQKNIRVKHQLDAAGQIAGRFASKVAFMLLGKHKVNYQPHMDQGDKIEVINLDQIKFTGKKLLNKMVYSHSGYPGRLKTTSLGKMMQDRPVKQFTKMVNAMLPKNKLRARIIKRLIIK